MPPIEAMRLGTKVITTRCASIPEVTQDKAIYVDNPLDECEWASAVLNTDDSSQCADFECYNVEIITDQYLKLFQIVAGE